MIVASNACNSESADEVMAATARLPVNATGVGCSGAAWRSITNMSSDNGTLVSTRVATP